MNLKSVAALTALVFVAACSTPKVAEYEGPKAMTRVETVQAIKECQYAKLKPNVEYVIQKTNTGKVLVPINVHCDPRMD